MCLWQLNPALCVQLRALPPFKVQLLVTSQDVDNYKQIKQDLDQLRSIVEKSELWVYKGQGPDEAMDSVPGENEHKKKEVIGLCLCGYGWVFGGCSCFQNWDKAHLPSTLPG